jgi:DegV family protein with EDD domain
VQRADRVSIVTDSAASLPPGLAAEVGPGLQVVSHQLMIDGTTYRDGLDLTAGEFYKTLRTLDQPPTTSAPSPAYFLEAFETASAVSHSVICLVTSPKFSATRDSALIATREASEKMPETRIEIVDTETAAGSGLLVLDALRSAADGHGVDEIVTRTAALVPRVKVIAFLDTLYYVWKGGRVPMIAHFGTSLLQIKPVFEMYRGEVKTVSKTRTANRAKAKLIDLMHIDVGSRKLHAAVLHGDALDEAREMEGRIASEFDCAELYISEFSPVMGAHTGPGLLGLAYWSEGEAV